MTSVGVAQTLCRGADFLSFGILDVAGFADRRVYYFVANYNVNDRNKMRIVAHLFYADGTSRVETFPMSAIAARREGIH